MKKPTLDEIKTYLKYGNWPDLLSSYQYECMKWLVSEVERLQHPANKLTEAIQNMIAVEEAVHHCPDCWGAWCPKHEKAFWEFWGVVKNNLPIGG